MTLKNYLKLLFHAIVTFIIIMLPVVISVVLLYNRIPVWAILVSGLISGLISIFPALKYMVFIAKNDDLFKDMF